MGLDEGSSLDHPYMPANLVFPGKFVHNTVSVPKILVITFGAFGAVLAFLWVVSARLNLIKRLQLCWFGLCAVIHLGLEGFFAYNNTSLYKRTDFLAQVWKEYAKADSRYVLSDPFVVAMEGTTAFLVGPLCALTAYLLYKGRPERYFWQLVVSVCQIYGCILYFGTEWLEDFVHERTDDPMLLYFYFLFLNSLWVTIPSILVVESYLAISNSKDMANISTSNTKNKAKRH